MLFFKNFANALKKFTYSCKFLSVNAVFSFCSFLVKKTFKPTKDLEKNNKNFINVVQMLMWVNYLSDELKNMKRKLKPYTSIEYSENVNPEVFIKNNKNAEAEKVTKELSNLIEKSVINNSKSVYKKS